MAIGILKNKGERKALDDMVDAFLGAAFGRVGTLIGGMILLPVLYWVFMKLYQPFFQEEGNRQRRLLHSWQELAVLLAAEVALYRIWLLRRDDTFMTLPFQLLYVMLAAMTVLCMTDLWEHIVPNRILAILLMLFLILTGFQAIRDFDVLKRMIPSFILGLLFCMISFGLGYLLSHKSMGAGDVKLALVMGLYLTGDYVVGAVFYGCLASAIFSVMQLLRKKLSRTDKIPFVPFLFIGTVIIYFIG